MITTFTYMLAQEVGACVYSRRNILKVKYAIYAHFFKKQNIDNCKKNERGWGNINVCRFCLVP